MISFASAFDSAIIKVMATNVPYLFLNLPYIQLLRSHLKNKMHLTALHHQYAFFACCYFYHEQLRELYHDPEREADVIEILAGKTRIIDIYNDLVAGYDLDYRGRRIE